MAVDSTLVAELKRLGSQKRAPGCSRWPRIRALIKALPEIAVAPKDGSPAPLAPEREEG
jgi:hypothetical protein